jgi:hypothetical protein
MIAYQLGWLSLIRSWDAGELAGKKVIMPAPGLKWNKLGALYEWFYEEYNSYSLTELREMFSAAADDFLLWFDGFTEDEVFQTGGRKWASSTPFGWPVWKWAHINTVAPFKSFRSKISKWKKLANKELDDIVNINSDSLSVTGGEGSPAMLDKLRFEVTIPLLQKRDLNPSHIHNQNHKEGRHTPKGMAARMT